MSGEITRVRALAQKVLQQLEREYQGIELASVEPQVGGALLILRWDGACARTLLPAWMIEAQTGPVADFAVGVLAHGIRHGYRKLLAEE